MVQARQVLALLDEVTTLRTANRALEQVCKQQMGRNCAIGGDVEIDEETKKFLRQEVDRLTVGGAPLVQSNPNAGTT